MLTPTGEQATAVKRQFLLVSNRPLPPPPPSRCVWGVPGMHTQTRYRNRRSESPKVGSAPSVFRDCFLPWLRDSAWPRLILVGFHAAEVCERTIPLASLIAAFGKWAFFAPLALAPGMIARYVARRAWTSRSGGDGGGIASSLRSTLNLSLVRTYVHAHSGHEHI